MKLEHPLSTDQLVHFRCGTCQRWWIVNAPPTPARALGGVASSPER